MKFKRFTCIQLKYFCVGANFRMFPYDNVYKVYLRNIELHFHTKKAHSTVNFAKLRKRYYHVVSLLRVYLFHFHKTRENIYYHADIVEYIFSFITYFM